MKEIQAAIIAVLVVGTALLNIGMDMVKEGEIGMGLLVIATGAGLIVIAVSLIKTLAEKVVEAKTSG